MKDLIQEHTLELLAAGALSPEESALILQRLEQQPEARAKLNELIEANEAFHQEYPAQYMLPHILRRAHSAQPPRTKRKKMKKLQAPLYGFAAIAAIALVIAGISQLNPQDSERADDKPPEAPTAQQPTPQPDAAPTLQAAKAPAKLLEKPAPSLWSTKELIFQLGEPQQFDGSGLSRISVESPDLVSVRPIKKGKQLELTPIKAGLTTLQLSQDGEDRVRYVRIAEATPDAVIAEALKRGEVRIEDRCLKGVALGAKRFRLVIDTKGGVLSAQVDDSADLDDKHINCLIDSAKTWRFKTQERAHYTVALITLAL